MILSVWLQRISLQFEFFFTASIIFLGTILRTCCQDRYLFAKKNNLLILLPVIYKIVFFIGKFSSLLFLLHDNARPHVGKQVKEVLNELNFEVLPYPPYFLGIAFYFFHHWIMDWRSRSLKNTKKFENRSINGLHRNNQQSHT